MGKSKCDKGRQDVLDFKCKKINISGVEKSSSPPPDPVQKPAVVGTDTLETQIVSPTPERTDKRPLQTKYKDEGSFELPERYKILVEFFDRMICSLRLLSLRKKSPTFQNISTLVEVLTNRKFTYNHLAQMKYILPEAVQIDKILVHDEKSLCMKPDMKISLLFDVIDGHQEKSAYIALRQFFTIKISNFNSTHPEDCDIPEAILPVPSNQRNQMIIPEALPADSSLQSHLTSANMNALSDSSHLNSSFTRYFSSKIPVEETERTQLSASPVRVASSRNDILTVESVKSGKQKDSIIYCSKSTFTEPPQDILPQYSVSPIACESPFVKLSSVADNPMVETPAQSTPKRSMTKCDNNFNSISMIKGTSCQKPTKRYIDFSCFEGDESGFHPTMDGEEFFKAGDNTIPNTDGTKGTSAYEIATGYPTLLEKVDDGNGCTATKLEMNQTGLGKGIHACLPDLVTLIHDIFQSTSCSSITKEELVHKIIMSNCDIMERREVEEQIEHLEKQVPDWICRRVTHSGDVLYNIRKVPDLDRVRARLISM